MYPVNAFNPTDEGNKSLNLTNNSSTNDTYGTHMITCLYFTINSFKMNIEIPKVFPLDVPAVISKLFSNSSFII